MKKFKQEIHDYGTDSYFSYREEYLAAANGQDKMNVLIKYKMIAPNWKNDYYLENL